MSDYIFHGANWLIFCLEDKESRYAIDSPFVVDGFMYATDWRICLRRKTDLPNTEGRRLPEKPHDLFRPMESDNWLQWPNEVSVTIGNDFRLCSCQYKTRSGEPMDLCGKCYGTGVAVSVASFAAVQLSSVTRIGLQYWHLVRSLRGVEWIAPTNPKESVRFRFTDGEGVLCVLAPDKERKAGV